VAYQDSHCIYRQGTRGGIRAIFEIGIWPGLCKEAVMNTLKRLPAVTLPNLILYFPPFWTKPPMENCESSHSPVWEK